MDVMSSNEHILSLCFFPMLPPLLKSWLLLSRKPLLFTLPPLPSVWMGITSALLWQGGFARQLLEFKSWISHLVRSAFKLLHFSEDVAAGWFLTPWKNISCFHAQIERGKKTVPVVGNPAVCVCSCVLKSVYCVWVLKGQENSCSKGIYGMSFHL